MHLNLHLDVLLFIVQWLTTDFTSALRFYFEHHVEEPKKHQNSLSYVMSTKKVFTFNYKINLILPKTAQSQQHAKLLMT